MVTAESLAKRVAYNLLSVSKNGGAVSPSMRFAGITDFKRHLWGGYKHAPHLEMIDSLLDSIRLYIATGGREGIGKAIINVPPRYGKTKTVSQYFPAHLMGEFPLLRFISVSYAANLARKNSRFIRNLVRTDAYQAVYPTVKLAPDSKSAHEWDNTLGGGMDAIGIGGSATGKGADVLIIDDPIKNREQAESLTYREKTWEAYTNDLYTRLEPNAVQIIMMTRWHIDDLVGRIEKYHSDEGWHYLVLPAIAQENDPLGRVVGEALWTAKYPIAKLRETEKLLGAYSWSALYQQKPTPSEGGIFKRAWFYPSPTEPPVIKRMVRYWDMAMSSNNSADYTVGVLLGEGVDGLYYVLDVARIQREWSDVVPFIKRVILGDGKGVRQGLEKKGYMSRAVGDLNKDRDLHGYVIGGYDVDTDKLTRALPVAAKLGAGVIKVLDGVWTDVFIDEMCMFPNGVHDDQVDALAGAWGMMDSTERRPISVETKKYV